MFDSVTRSMSIREFMKVHAPSRGTLLGLCWIGVVMMLLGVGAIATAETFMPDNDGGRKGLLALYRAFGPFTLAWATISVGSFAALRLRFPKQ